MNRSRRYPTPSRAVLVLILAASFGCSGSKPPGDGAAAPATTGAAAAPSASWKYEGCAAVPVPPGDYPLLGDPRACKGGTFVMETNSYPTHFNYYGPERDLDLKTHYNEAMLNTLVSIHPETKQIIPELASSWEILEDGKVLIFHLDPDAKWSDGKPITAADVQATYDLILHPKVVEVEIKSELEKFARPEALDERTVKFVHRNASWRNVLLFEDVFIYPAHAVKPETYLEDWRNAAPVVSGQYTLGELVSGQSFKFERRKDFWGEGKRQFIGTGNFDTLHHKAIFDDAITFETAKKGDIDFYLVTKAQRWAEECDFDQVKKGWMQKARMFHRTPEVPSQMAFNLESPLFSDVRVRKGLFYLYNREYLHDQLFFHEYVNKNSYWANSIYENPGNEKVTFNAEKGLALLAEAGFTSKDPDGTLKKGDKRLEFDLVYIHPSAERTYTPIQETFRKYGVKMNLKLVSPSVWIKLSQDKEFEFIYANWGPLDFPNPRDMWHSEKSAPKDTSNIGHFKNAEVDRLIEAYELEPDFDKRAALIRQMDAIIYEQYPYLLDWYSSSYRMLWWDKFGMPEWMTYPTQDVRHTLWKVWWWDAGRAERLEKARAAGAAVPLAPPENTHWKQ